MERIYSVQVWEEEEMVAVHHGLSQAQARQERLNAYRSA